ncbi:MAG: YidC/Oxa1 family insertase periplasmic-domain containing protein [Kiritimatiellae bacterium]|jgi:YidC/Oxa1 family membrane protein insertase|nr:YidC/Oxa1 family insertase periplasmic-domain containing protein [Kiritimatiellia bacterium]
MNRQEISIVVLLFAMLIGWGVYKHFNPAPVLPPPVVQAESVINTNDVSRASEPQAFVADKEPSKVMEVIDAVKEARFEEKTCVVSNDTLNITFSSAGASVVNVALKDYKEENTENSAPVTLSFTNAPSLVIGGIPGFGENHNFELVYDEGKSIVTMSKSFGSLSFVRKAVITNDYVISVEDTFENISSSVIIVPTNTIRTGVMEMIQTTAMTRGISYLGLDSLNKVGKKDEINYWGKIGIIKKSPLIKQFKLRKDLNGIFPKEVNTFVEQPTYWLAAKNKFFVQIINPLDELAVNAELHAMRNPEINKPVIERVYGSLIFPEKALQPGEEFTRKFEYYVGPKECSVLKSLGERQVDVMQFGKMTWFKWLCTILLKTLNFIYSIIPNYGVAIILLTVLVKVIFWPITHKSTESMKKMQELQPKLTVLKKKYENKPKELQMATMELYRDNKVSPFSSCLPMLIQIPVFIALFTVLRSAVELRFSSFLWITNLSEPENLLAGVLPIPLNILPLVMTAISLLQQKMTPAGGDPQQKKMMMFMPIMMLFIFYKMPSALVLYWTVSQLLAVLQLYVQRKGGFRKLLAK